MSIQIFKRSKDKKLKIYPDLSLKLLNMFIHIAISKGYLTEDQCKEILYDMRVSCSIQE